MPSADELNALLHYDAETGLLFWKERPGSNRFNGARAGKCACHLSRFGYHVVSIHRRHWQAHRIIWKMSFGEDPPEIDHISGNRSDNRLSNLRRADRQQNMRNLALRHDSKSGRTGVSKTIDGTWRAYINLPTGFQHTVWRFGFVRNDAFPHQQWEKRSRNQYQRSRKQNENRTEAKLLSYAQQGWQRRVP